MNIQIEGWCGRLGNNIHQLIVAISIGLHNNWNIIIPSHPFFTTTYLMINENVTRDDSIALNKIFFGDTKDIDNISEIIRENVNETTDLDDYFHKQRPWKNTKEQRDTMLKYNLKMELD